jgi:hypothetical protein
MSPLAWSLGATALTRTGSTRFSPFDYQAAVLRDRSPRRLVLKSRQVGMSQAVGIEARWAAENEPETTTLFVSRNQDLAAELIRYSRGCYPERESNPIIKDNSFALTFQNGARIISQPATRNAGRGIPARRAYLDEFAFAEYDQDIWRSIAPTADQVTVLSTPNGRANAFYLMWAGQYGDGWTKHLIHWTQDPRKWTPAERAAGIPATESAWYRRERGTYTNRDWASEFECDFVESGGAVFPSELCERVYNKRLPTGDPNSWVHAPGSVTYWDLGARQDATVGVTVAKLGGRLPVVAFARYEAPNEWPAMERAIADRCARYPDGRHFVESNGIGDPFISHLREKGLQIEEFLVTARSKQDMIRALALASEQDRFRHGSPELYVEMLRYQVDDTKLVQDCVMAASGAVHMADQGGILLTI